MKTKLFRAAIFTPMTRGRWGLPMLAWSKPGEAKSAVLRELCEQVNLPLVVLSPGEMGEGAFGVIPVPDRSGVIKYPPPEWTSTFKDEQGRDLGGVVFVDEATCVPPALAPALLGLVLDGRIGGTVLGPRVRRIAAANPPEYAANGYDLNPAQANRLGHIEWSAPSVDEHAAYMMRGTTGSGGVEESGFSPDDEEKRVLEAWNGGAWARAVALEVGFLRTRQDAKNKCPRATDPNAGKAWPSDRSWENATRALASAQIHGLSQAETDEFVSAFIGHAAYKEWKVWIAAQDLPDSAALLDGRIPFEHDNARIDRTYAVMTSCITLLAPKDAPHREDRAVAFWKILTTLFSSGVNQDVVILPCQQLVALKLGSNSSNPKLIKAYAELGKLPRFGDLLRACGMTK